LHIYSIPCLRHLALLGAGVLINVIALFCSTIKLFIVEMAGCMSIPPGQNTIEWSSKDCPVIHHTTKHWHITLWFQKCLWNNTLNDSVDMTNFNIENFNTFNTIVNKCSGKVCAWKQVECLWLINSFTARFPGGIHTTCTINHLATQPQNIFYSVTHLTILFTFTQMTCRILSRDQACVMQNGRLGSWNVTHPIGSVWACSAEAVVKERWCTKLSRITVVVLVVVIQQVLHHLSND